MPQFLPPGWVNLGLFYITIRDLAQCLPSCVTSDLLDLRPLSEFQNMAAYSEPKLYFVLLLVQASGSPPFVRRNPV